MARQHRRLTRMSRHVMCRGRLIETFNFTSHTFTSQCEIQQGQTAQEYRNENTRLTNLRYIFTSQFTVMSLSSKRSQAADLYKTGSDPESALQIPSTCSCDLLWKLSTVCNNARHFFFRLSCLVTWKVSWRKLIFTWPEVTPYNATLHEKPFTPRNEIDFHT